ncbi:RidA family protein [Teredinibacter haidensis]|uniref:RidA family protein n=1 Tax=Teredinibacter haidensis TaxID=2731755 RepID=UPI000948DBA8|nr:RidA family protein [Teredinibacter haidensis]
MLGKIKARIKELDIELPEPSNPGGSYVPYHISGSLLFLTGQLCHWNGDRLFTGKLGAEFDTNEGSKAASICALNLLSQVDKALDGDLDRVVKIIRLAGYVNSTPDFHGQSQVMNGASELFIEVFGEKGKHTRLAVGVSSLPYNVAVEVEGVVEISPA